MNLLEEAEQYGQRRWVVVGERSPALDVVGELGVIVISAAEVEDHVMTPVILLEHGGDVVNPVPVCAFHAISRECHRFLYVCVCVWIA